MSLSGDCHPAESKEIEVKPSEDCYVEDPCLPKDPNLCTREVPYTGEQQPEYYILRVEFEKLNIPFPNILSVSKKIIFVLISITLWTYRPELKDIAVTATESKPTMSSANPCVSPTVVQMATARHQTNVRARKTTTWE